VEQTFRPVAAVATLAALPWRR